MPVTSRVKLLTGTPFLADKRDLSHTGGIICLQKGTKTGFPVPAVNTAQHHTLLVSL
jgi:hypothetical protein